MAGKAGTYGTVISDSPPRTGFRVGTDIANSNKKCRTYSGILLLQVVQVIDYSVANRLLIILTRILKRQLLRESYTENN